MTAAQTAKKTVVAYLDRTKPYAIVTGDSVARFLQGGRHFDNEGFVVSMEHATRPAAEVVDAHEAHKDRQRQAREEAKAKAESASKSLGNLLGDEPDEPEAEEPETGWTKDAVEKKFRHRESDIRKLSARSNAALVKACKNGKLPANEAEGASAKWENIHTLLSATDAAPKGDQTRPEKEAAAG